MTTSRGATKPRANRSRRGKTKHRNSLSGDSKPLWEIDVNLQQEGQGGQSKRKLTKAPPYVPGTQDSNANNKAGEGFTCPHPGCDTLCSYDDEVCPGCNKGCEYRPGLGGVMTEDRPTKIGVLPKKKRGGGKPKKSRAERRTSSRNSRSTEPPNKSPAKARAKSPVEAQAKEPSEAPAKATSKVPSETPSEVRDNDTSKAPSRDPAKAPAEAFNKAPTKAPVDAAVEAPVGAPTGAPAVAKDPVEAAAEYPTKDPVEAAAKDRAESLRDEIARSDALVDSLSAQVSTLKSEKDVMAAGIEKELTKLATRINEHDTTEAVVKKDSAVEDEAGISTLYQDEPNACSSNYGLQPFDDDGYAYEFGAQSDSESTLQAFSNDDYDSEIEVEDKYDLGTCRKAAFIKQDNNSKPSTPSSELSPEPSRPKNSSMSYKSQCDLNKVKSSKTNQDTSNSIIITPPRPTKPLLAAKQYLNKIFLSPPGMKDLKQQLRKKDDELRSLTNQVGEKDAELQRVRKEKELLKKEKELLETYIYETLRLFHKKYFDMMDGLKNQLAEKDARIEALQNQLAN